MQLTASLKSLKVEDFDLLNVKHSLRGTDCPQVPLILAGAKDSDDFLGIGSLYKDLQSLTKTGLPSHACTFQEKTLLKDMSMHQLDHDR